MAVLRGIATAVVAVVCIGLPARVAAGGDAVWDGGKTCPLLTPGNFDGHLAKQAEQKRPILVMFHVSWCKVCQRTFPEYVAASKKVQERGLAMDFAHVDCTDDKSLCSRFMVKGYPTIKLFAAEEGVEPRTFKGQRSESSFVKYAQRMLLPPVSEMPSAEQLDKIIRSETFSAFVAAIPSGKAVPAGLESAATEWMDRHIFASSERLVNLLPKAAARPPADAVLAVISLGARQQWSGRDNSSEPEPAVQYYQGSLDDAAAVSKWVTTHRFPGVWGLHETNFYEFVHAQRRTALLADDLEQISAATEKAFRDAASELSDEFIFGVVNGASWSDELADFNIYKKDLPRILVTDDNFETWVEDIDALRPATVTADLRSFVGGAPLLRQNRNTLSRIFFYYREARLFIGRQLAHAAKGPTEAATVIGCALLILSVAFGTLWCLYKLFATLLCDPDDYDYVKAAEARQQQKKAN